MGKDDDNKDDGSAGNNDYGHENDHTHCGMPDKDSEDKGALGRIGSGLMHLIKGD